MTPESLAQLKALAEKALATKQAIDAYSQQHGKIPPPALFAANHTAYAAFAAAAHPGTVLELIAEIERLRDANCVQ